jgi:adenosylcobinamide kinase/adenosylcobinamide-phosphate guanylyltransferase
MTASTFNLPTKGPFAALILGGARSGKSRYGEALVRATSGRAVYIATAEARDLEMSKRIAKHREQRGSDWALIEEPVHLARVLREQIRAEDVVLVDCLTLWLSNLLGAGRDVAAAVDELLAAIEVCPARVVLISNEIGWGIVPDNALARTFRDEAGRLHQRLSAQIDAVVAVIAGLPLMLKEPGGP